MLQAFVSYNFLQISNQTYGFQVNRLLNALKNCTASMTLSVRQEIASYFVPELEAFVDLINELGRYSMFYQSNFVT